MVFGKKKNPHKCRQTLNNLSDVKKDFLVDVFKNATLDIHTFEYLLSVLMYYYTNLNEDLNEDLNDNGEDICSKIYNMVKNLSDKKIKNKEIDIDEFILNNEEINKYTEYISNHLKSKPSEHPRIIKFNTNTKHKTKKVRFAKKNSSNSNNTFFSTVALGKKKSIKKRKGKGKKPSLRKKKKKTKGN